jgi:hypothetical protein
MKAIDQVYNLMSQAREKILKVGENLNFDQIQKDLEKLRKQVQQQGQKKMDLAKSNTLSTLNRLQKEYTLLFKRVEKAQTQAKKDVTLVKKNLMKQMVQLEKQMIVVRKKLEGKKAQLEKLFVGKKKSAKKATAKKTTRKTTTKKAVRK